MKELILRLLESYEKRVHSVSSITRDSQHLIDRSRERRFSLSGELREKLARRDSLRRKDFDTIISPLQSYYHKQEGALSKCLSENVHDHQDVAGYLKSLLALTLHDPVDPEKEQILHLQTKLGKVKRKLDDRERKVAQVLEKYHDDQLGYEDTMGTLLWEGCGGVQQLKNAVSALLSEVLENGAQPTTAKKEEEKIP